MFERGFRGRVVEQTHAILLDGDPDEVFALFGPVREADWAADWNPEIVAGDGHTPERGCVFRTYHDDRGETIWLLAGLDRDERWIEYVRVTPLSDLAEITIRVDQPEPGRSRAEVTYRIVGLTVDANHYVDGFTEARYAALIDEWATAINHYRTTGERLAPEL